MIRPTVVRLSAALALAFLAARTAPGQTGPVLNPANGHYYQRVDAVYTWADARDQAAASTFQGLPGHLLTAGSSLEESFVVNNLGLGAVTNHWLGGFQPAGSPEPAGGWQWVTGEPWSYTHWYPGEPNNDFQGSPENALEYTGNPGGLGFWNDAFEGGFKGYIVEYEPVPEPAGLLALGLLVPGVRRLRRRIRRP